MFGILSTHSFRRAKPEIALRILSRLACPSYCGPVRCFVAGSIDFLNLLVFQVSNNGEKVGVFSGLR
jgi:hypothetical protein